MDDLQLLALLGRPSWAPTTEPRDGRPEEIAALAWSNIRRLVVEHAHNLRAVDADPHLSAAGKAARKAEMAAKAGGDLERLRPLVGKLKARRADVLAKMTPAGAGLSDPAQAVLAVEVWRQLQGDALLTRIAYEAALEADDRLVMQAIESLPSTHSGRLDAATLSDLRLRRVEREHPEQARTLAELEDHLAVVEGALNAAQTAINDKPQTELEVRHGGGTTRVRLDEEAA